MATKRKYGKEQFEEVILQRAFGKGTSAIADELGCSKNFTTCVAIVFDAVKNREWDKAVEAFIRYRPTMSLMDWAARKTGTTVPLEVKQKIEHELDASRKKMLEDVKKETEEKKAEQVAPQAQAVTCAPEHWPEEKLMLAQMITALNKQNELLETLMDVVIPKYVGDIKDNLNANFDVLQKQMQGCEEKMEAVKLALRKRGM